MTDLCEEIGFLFDLDGVIIDSESEYTKIWQLINLEYPTEYNDLAVRIKGTTLSKILNDYFLPEQHQEVTNRLHQLENQMQYKYLPFAKEFLITLKSRNFATALVTSSDETKMNRLWAQLPELKDYFLYIVTGDQVSSSKPSPEGYILGAQKINRDPRHCVVFEDSLQGVMAGKNAGAFVVGVAGTLPKETLAPYSQLLIERFSDIDLEDLILNISQIIHNE